MKKEPRKGRIFYAGLIMALFAAMFILLFGVSWIISIPFAGIVYWSAQRITRLRLSPIGEALIMWILSTTYLLFVLFAGDNLIYSITVTALIAIAVGFIAAVGVLVVGTDERTNDEDTLDINQPNPAEWEKDEQINTNNDDLFV